MLPVEKTMEWFHFSSSKGKYVYLTQYLNTENKYYVLRPLFQYRIRPSFINLLRRQIGNKHNRPLITLNQCSWSALATSTPSTRAPNISNGVYKFSVLTNRSAIYLATRLQYSKLRATMVSRHEDLQDEPRPPSLLKILEKPRAARPMTEC